MITRCRFVLLIITVVFFAMLSSVAQAQNKKTLPSLTYSILNHGTTHSVTGAPVYFESLLFTISDPNNLIVNHIYSIFNTGFDGTITFTQASSSEFSGVNVNDGSNAGILLTPPRDGGGPGGIQFVAQQLNGVVSGVKGPAVPGGDNGLTFTLYTQTQSSAPSAQLQNQKFFLTQDTLIGQDSTLRRTHPRSFICKTTLVPVPEPSPMALFGLGGLALLGLTLLRRASRHSGDSFSH